MLAFCASAPIVLTTTILLSRFIVNFWATLLALLLAPLQGFNNSLIFFRPRIFRWCSSCFQKLISRRLSDGHGESPTETNHTTGRNNKSIGNDSLSIREVSGADQREHEEFMRSHLYGSLSLEQEDTSEQLGPRRESILIGSMQVPSIRGSQLWDNREPEVSDYVCEEEDVVHSDRECMDSDS